MLKTMRKAKKYNKPEVKNLGKIGSKTQYAKPKAGSDGTSSTRYNGGHNSGIGGVEDSGTVG